MAPTAVICPLPGIAMLIVVRDVEQGNEVVPGDANEVGQGVHDQPR